MPFCHFVINSPRPKCGDYPKRLNSLGDHLRARRIDLGLFQAQVAKQIAVHELTITNWEGNESEPAVRYIPAIIGFLGYNPFSAGESLADRLALHRRAQGLSQREMATRLGVDCGTVRGWESGAHQPAGRKLELLKAIL